MRQLVLLLSNSRNQLCRRQDDRCFNNYNQHPKRQPQQLYSSTYLFLVLFATTNLDMFCAHTIRSEKSISNTITSKNTGSNVNNNNHSSSTAKPSQSSASTSGGSSSTAAAYIKAVRSELGAEYEVFKRILSKYRVDKDLETLVANVTFLMFVENTKLF